MDAGYQASVRTVREALAANKSAVSAFEAILEYDSGQIRHLSHCSRRNCSQRMIEVTCTRGHTSKRP